MNKKILILLTSVILLFCSGCGKSTPDTSTTPSKTPAPETPAITEKPEISEKPTPIPTDIPEPDDEISSNIVAIKSNPQEESSDLAEEGMLSPSSDGDSMWNSDKMWTLTQTIFIGDSRTVDMMNTCAGGSEIWICQVGTGYKWMVNTAFAQADKYINEGTAVVIALGVNDVHNQNNYISAINAKAEEWASKGAHLFFVSVGPVEHDPYVNNQGIVNFNRALYGNLNTSYIDIYNELVINGFKTTDGIHYDTNTTKRIYNCIKDVVSQLQ